MVENLTEAQNASGAGWAGLRDLGSSPPSATF